MSRDALGFGQVREIDLMAGTGSRHPDLRTDGTRYLVQYNGQWMVGTFGTVWYGLNFHPTLGHTCYQYDTPGSNGVMACWERVIEIDPPPSMHLQDYTGYEPAERKQDKYCACCGCTPCYEDEEADL